MIPQWNPRFVPNKPNYHLSDKNLILWKKSSIRGSLATEAGGDPDTADDLIIWSFADFVRTWVGINSASQKRSIDMKVLFRSTGTSLLTQIWWNPPRIFWSGNSLNLALKCKSCRRSVWSLESDIPTSHAYLQMSRSKVELRTFWHYLSSIRYRVTNKHCLTLRVSAQTPRVDRTRRYEIRLMIPRLL